MIFGDPTDIAIEAITELHLVAPSAIWGRMCLHIGNTVLGDISDQHCSLYLAYCRFKALLDTATPIWDDSFNGLSHEQIHDLVHNAIYGDDARSVDKILADSQRYKRFDFLTNWGEQFDGFASVLIQEDELTTTILHRPHSSWIREREPGSFLVLDCTTIGFRSACSGFVEWFDKEATRLTPKEGRTRR